ncbi:MAG: hypothetical protein LBD27_01215 [Tannerella sp.]|jgi:hypothetical protein|nr:hypothetical protein [Tannerella sp.]
MENKEQLEQLIAQIKRFAELTNEIRTREIYPLSFFSEAFDITHRMQELLHGMETSELALFERQMKEHQSQIRSVGTLSTKKEPTLDGTATAQADERKHTPSAPPPPHVRMTAPPPLPASASRPLAEKTDDRLNETIEKKRLSDLKKAFSLNDRFRFCRDLFARDENLMNRTIVELNVKDSYAASVAYLKERFNWNFEDEAVAAFVAILEKRFS